MSASDGGKPAQTGLVDMGTIQFYNLPGEAAPFAISDLQSYPGSFSEMVLNVTWNQLQPTPGAIDVSAIESALSAVAAYNTQHAGANLGLKLRVWGGFTAPDWAKNLGGPPITITGESVVYPQQTGPQTIGRWWTGDFINAWTSLQNGLASRYDSNPLIRGISQTAGGSASDEPFVPFKLPGQIYATQRAGFTDAAQMLTLRAAIADYGSWSTTPLDFTFNPSSVLDSFIYAGGNSPTLDDNIPLAILQQARNSTRLVQAGNHTIGANFASVEFILTQLAADAQLDPAAVPASYQTDSPLKIGDVPGHSNYPGWQAAVQIGVENNAGNIELWDYSENNGFRGLSPTQVHDLAIQVANGVAPTTGAPDDGSALAFLAPAFVAGSPGTIAFTGTDAVLLESATAQGTYNVTLTSLGGHTLSVVNHSLPAPLSGATLSFSGSLAQVNTVLASLTDTLSSGTDVIQVTATDSSGHTAVRTVGVQISASAPAPGPSTPNSGPAAFASNGLLVVGGVNSSQSYAGNLQIGTGGTNTLLAALSPSAYSTASLTVGGTLEVMSGGNAFFSGALGAQTVQIDLGGALIGNGTVAGTVGFGIANNGTIEAVADRTLGLQRLMIGNVGGSGTGKLVIDAGATLVLNGTVTGQTIEFQPNTNLQFANAPYSPSTLELTTPQSLSAPIMGFTFADRLVLDGVAAKTNPGSLTFYSGSTLSIEKQGGGTLTFDLSNANLGGLDLTVLSANNQTVVSFAAPPAGLPPSIGAPVTLEGASGSPVLVPDIVVNTPLPAATPSNTTVNVAVKALSGTLSASKILGHPTLAGNGTGDLILSGTLDEVQRSLQTLTYTAPAGGSPGTTTITITASDYSGLPSAPTTITVHNNQAPLQFNWQNSAGGSFDVTGNWTTSASHFSPPGGTNVAAFGPGTYTVSGDGAVGQILALGMTTLTGQVTAQGRGGPAAIVDHGGALTLAGGAVLSAQQETIVGGSGEGLLVLMGGALDITGSQLYALMVGEQSGSNGTVVNLEQIKASGTVVVGGAGTGTLLLRGVASTVLDGGADIGQSAGGVGNVVVNGGEWMNSGMLTVGDAGMGNLTINGMAGGITGQVTAYNAAIGNKASGSGTVTLDGGEMLIANGGANSSILAVGVAGSADLELEDGSEVAVGAAQATVNNHPVLNTGLLIVGGSAGGRGRVRVSGNSSMLVYGSATVGGGAGTGQVTVGESADDRALFALMGTLAINATGQIGLGGANALVRASAVTVARGGMISGAGTLSGLGGGNRTVTLASIDNDGSIAANGGELLIYGSIGGTGTLSVADGATMVLQAGVGSGQTVTFGSSTQAAGSAGAQAAGSTGKLVLNDPRAFAGTITGFGTGDLLELASTQATGASWSDGVLTIDTAFGPIRLNLAGVYASNFFSVQSDGLGGTFVAGGHGDVHMVCFDRLEYDFMAIGDFVAVQSTLGDPWQIQIRTDGFAGATSITTGLAAMVGNVRVSFANGRAVEVDGAPLPVGGAQSFGGGWLAQLSGNAYKLSWNTGRSVTVTDQGGYLDWAVGLGSQDGPGSVKGLLGGNSGPDTDFLLPDGTKLGRPSADVILGVFADAWRVKQGASLLDDLPSPAILVQAMAANLVPSSPVYQGQPPVDANAQGLLAPSPLHS